MRLVVIGGNAAGMSGAAKAKRTDDSIEAVVFEAGPHISYSACGIPYRVHGVVEDAHDLMVLDDEKAAKRGIEVHRHSEVTSIDAGEKVVRVRGPAGVREEPYDRLLVATGVKPRDPFDASGLDGVFTLRHLHDGERFLAHLEKSECKQAAIVGGGYIGLELGDAMAARGIETTMLQRSGALLTTMDADMTEPVKGDLEQNGVRVLLEADVDAIEEHGGRLRVRSREEVDVDAVVLGVGVVPNTTLAQDAGVEVDDKGFIVVDESMRTNVEGIWAAGDCAATPNILTGKRQGMPLALPANEMGKIAGHTIAGGDSTFPGVLGTAIVRVCGKAYAQTGLTEKAAARECIDHVAKTITAHHKAGYMPGDGEVRVKIVAAPDGRLLGVQMAGPAEGGLRIQAAAMAVQHGLTAHQVAQTETAYAPPFSAVHDPLAICARQVDKEIG